MGLDPATSLARVYRESHGRVLSVLIARLRDFDLAEDALQDAMIEAARVWPEHGAPDNGAGWLLKVAQRRAIDRLRKQKRAPLNIPDDPGDNEASFDIPDERLRLIFTCCHPALSHEAQVALTLRALCGLETAEIARAFLTSTSTMNQRITRAKAKIRDAGIAYKIPEAADVPARLGPVLSVIYLIYNEGYAPLEGQNAQRLDLSLEALRLARLLHYLLPHPEIAGLLALMILHSSRGAARASNSGEFIPLEEQNRRLWDRGAISEGREILHAALALRQAGPYQIQAAISALHSEAAEWAATDWPQIRALYGVLYAKQPSPVVALNHAVAVANAGELDKALLMLGPLGAQLPAYQPYFATRGALLACAGQEERAKQDYQKAINLTSNAAQRDYLRQKLLELG